MSSPFPTYYNYNFKFQIETTYSNFDFVLPIKEGGSGYIQNFTVNWGDGSSNVITSYDDANRWHIYVTTGTYDITLTGTCEYFNFNNVEMYGEDSQLSLRNLLSFFGDMGFKVLNFSGCENLVGIVNFGNMSSLVNASHLFDGCNGVISIPSTLLSRCPNITDLSYSFVGCTHLEVLPDGLFDNNQLVTTFDYAFQNNQELTGNAPTLWLRNPEPSGLYCFYQCTSLSNYASIPESWT
jgi:hypothetical protein